MRVLSRVVSVSMVTIGCLYASSAVQAEPLRMYQPTSLLLQQEVDAVFATTSGGLEIATGDLDGDGRDEVILAAGRGDGPQVQIRGRNGALVGLFDAYDSSVRTGMTVAAGDLDGDGRDEIITGAGYGGAPHVRVFDAAGNSVFTPGFFAYDQTFRGGVYVAAGDVNGDGRNEIITGAGSGGGPHVRVFNRYGVSLGVDIYPFATSFRGGVRVATANLTSHAGDEILVSPARYAAAEVKVYRADDQRTVVNAFRAFPDTYRSGVTLASGDTDGDGVDEILVGTETGGGPQVRIFDRLGRSLAGQFFAYDGTFRGGVRTAYLRRSPTSGSIVTVPGSTLGEGRTDLYQYIDVNLSTQQLTLYRNRVREWTTAISSGIAKYPTPEGTFSVLAKIALKDYEWTYGPEHPDNYDLPDVPWNLRFVPNYYLHGAYWHNNFGHRMSHGCVNLSIADAARVYQWASVGTPVIVHR